MCKRIVRRPSVPASLIVLIFDAEAQGCSGRLGVENWKSEKSGLMRYPDKA
jgi:hypothetical protein